MGTLPSGADTRIAGSNLRILALTPHRHMHHQEMGPPEPKVISCSSIHDHQRAHPPSGVDTMASEIFFRTMTMNDLDIYNPRPQG